MSLQEIELKKVRNFSEKLNTTLSLIRVLFKPLMLSQLAISFPVLLIGSIVTTMLAVDSIDGIMAGNPTDTFESVKIQLVSGLLTLPGIILLIVLGIAVVRLYERTKSAEMTVGEIWAEGKNDILPVAGILLLTLLIITVGVVFLIIPGLIFSIRLAIAAPLYMTGNDGIGDSIEKSWNYTKGKWWITFGYFLILYILAMIVGFVLGLPVIVLGMLQGISMAEQGGAASDFPKTILYVSMILAPLISLTYLIQVIGLTVYGYSLREENEATGLQEKIAAIGETEANG